MPVDYRSNIGCAGITYFCVFSVQKPVEFTLRLEGFINQIQNLAVIGALAFVLGRGRRLSLRPHRPVRVVEYVEFASWLTNSFIAQTPI